jgi:adenine-specific DNA-methyltransferase
LRKENKPTYLIDIERKDLNNEIKKYLKIGINLGIHKRYKSSIRENWFSIPNIQTPSEGLFFKRCHEYPKLIINQAKVFATDSAYLVSMRNGFDITDFVFSFYNSLTLVFSELNGRYYGGGVLELTPNEFKHLPVPHVKVTNEKFDLYTIEFINKSNIMDICDHYDKEILKSVDYQISDDDISKIRNIRNKLFIRRNKIK